jgi:uncharacterized membrane protein
MNRLPRWLGPIIAVLGIALLVLGVVFLALGASKSAFLTNAMQEEQITLGIESDEAAEGQFIDTMSEAEMAGNTIREHRRGIAPTYGDLLGDGRFDPSDPEQLSYAQALNLENYLYLAVAAFGLTQLAMGVGAGMVLTGLAFLLLGIVLFMMSRRETVMVPASRE